MTRGRRSRSQGGSTLLEAILVMLLVGMVIVALATGLATLTVSANTTNATQRLSLATTTFTEALRDLPYRQGAADCTPQSDAATYMADYDDLPPEKRSATTGVTLEIIDIDYWKGNRGDTAAPTVPAAAQWSAGCSDVSGAQKLTVRLTLPSGTPGGKGSYTAEVVKRQSNRQEG